MSQTFSLICRETEQRIWIGQGWGSMQSLYCNDKANSLLKKFLNAHAGKALTFVCDDVEDDIWDYADWGDENDEGRSHDPPKPDDRQPLPSIGTVMVREDGFKFFVLKPE